MISDYGTDLPKRQTIYSAGYDFYSPDDYDITPGEVTFIDTGIHLEDRDFENVQPCVMFLFPRSSYGKYGMRFTNTTGVIDMDYRDSIKAMIVADKPFHISKGDRFMQGVFVPVIFIPTEDSPTAERNGGIGSTGNNK